MVGDLNKVQTILDAAEKPYEMISTMTGFGLTALHWAVIEGRNEIAQMLLNIAEQNGLAKDFIDIANSTGETALELARQSNGRPCSTTKVIELLESYACTNK